MVTIIGILGICTMVGSLVAMCYVFSDKFLDSKPKDIRYYRCGNYKKSIM